MKRHMGPLLPVIARVILTLLLCAAAGFAIGIAIAYRSTEAKAVRYARNLVALADSYTDEIRTTLEQVNASPYPFCSDEDIARLRVLVFHGRFVKDVGRNRNGLVYCTSMSGRFAAPIPEGKPDIVARSGRAILLNRPVMGVPGMRGDITEDGKADFIAAVDTFSHLREPPMTYTSTLVNRATGEVVRTAGDALKLSSAEVLGEKEVFRGGAFYVARCSDRYAPCMVTSITLSDAWAVNAFLLRGFVILGALTGAALSIALVLQPRRRTLAMQLRRALRRNLLTLVYQPIVNVKTGEILGAEALARWTNEEGEYVPPDVFVAAAEELGIIGRLTRVVLRLIVAEMGEYLRAHPGFRINVNIAAADLADPQFLPMLEKTLRRHGVASTSINLELTERSTADHHLTVASIGKLRSRGHEFYIDDFGTGYSTLSYLNELAVDAIKIDRAFTDAVGTGSLTAAIVPQILAMAEALHIKVVVEGVERAEQSQYFANLNQGILAQGWHFGEPVPAEELLALLESKTKLEQRETVGSVS